MPQTHIGQNSCNWFLTLLVQKRFKPSVFCHQGFKIVQYRVECFFQHHLFVCRLVVIVRHSEQAFFKWYLEIVLVIVISRLCLNIFFCYHVSSWHVSPGLNILAPTRSCIVFQYFSYKSVHLPIYLFDHSQQGKNTPQ